ncbi:S8 family serine peptidase [Hymenobacter weizhouensis]|uniref:S8 family serine peptidase n=1 Tax=Hymenobacter sp. YIM 151500-1 TaxID=2987689 RepID=UPI0022271F97|nr:S8 family serine peptidase [Hymenobacter sp. YIM 151500-1]UYZ63094.1 S8 family serine peptidase [Hymenobacter sp. YIM 151500-1]
MNQTLPLFATGLRTAWSVLLVLACFGSPVRAQVADAPLPPNPGLRKATVPAGFRPKAPGKLSQELLALREPTAAAAANRRPAPGASKSANSFLQVRNGLVVVNIVAAGNAQALANELKTTVGLTNAAVAKQLISGAVPIRNLDKLGANPKVRFVRAAYKPRLKAGAATSQGDKAQRSDLARQVAGVTGRGVKVGVISDSYDRLNGAAAGIASADLPGPGNPTGRTTPVQVLQELAAQDSSGSDEGRAMLEIIHDVAPDAELAFHTGFGGGEATFAQAVLKLADAGCQVIVDDLGFPDEPFFSDGVSTQAIDEVKRRGVSFFTAVGNYGDAAYEHSFQPSTFEPFGPGTGTAHNFSAPGQPPRYYQPVRIGREGVFIGLFQWDDPFFSVTGDTAKQARTDLDIYLLDDALQVVAASTLDNLAIGDPIEGLFYEKTDTTMQNDVFYVVITQAAGPAPRLMKYIQFGDADFVNPAASPIPGIGASTAFGHVLAPGAISVGAAWYEFTPPFLGVDTAYHQFLFYQTSYSKTPILFDKNGNRLSSPVYRQKPEITAPDGANTSFFGFDLEGDGFPNFFGTSAAAPHAAGVAALMIEAYKKPLPPDLVKSAMTRTALDMDDLFTDGVFDQGFDYTTGYGLLQADKAVQEVLSTVTATAPGAADPAARLVAYPSPFGRELSVLLPGRNQRPATVKLYNLQGQLVHDQVLTPRENEAGKLDLPNLAAGLYMLHVEQAGSPLRTLKVQKQ